MSSINISVAMATYNGEKYIRRQLMSILNQSMVVDEIIVVDDNSDDRTIEIIEELNCPRIYIFKNDKKGVYLYHFIYVKYLEIWVYRKFLQGNIINTWRICFFGRSG